ncbi:MAG TPA: hypothetical protein VGO11_25240 [Chthoniobacteraceae bacterium]|jgi:hypothetical protein|nr:hypothetical protein [Chthoniobacteraceae bacterium]
MIHELCAVIRKTGVSDSGAAARVSLHPSTVSRWKKEFPDLAILLRSAREDFREAQLAIIEAAAQAGRATSWRAAAWLLERVFPEDYAPRAAERAKFQERFDAICAAEDEGGAIALPTKAEPLQNVKNSAPLEALAHPAAPAPGPECELTLPLTTAPRGGAMDLRLPETPLQNVKNSALAGPVCPPMLSTKTVSNPA